MKRKFPRFIAALIILGGGGAGAFYIMSLMNTPAEGVIQPVKESAEQSDEKKENKQANLDGKYVKFDYPETYRLTPSPKNTHLETINLLGSGISEGEIVVSVSQGSLAEDSAVRLRRLQKEIYTEQALELPNLKGVVFTKPSPGFEKTAFAEHAGMVVSIAISSSVNKSLDEVFDLVTKSFTWK